MSNNITLILTETVEYSYHLSLSQKQMSETSVVTVECIRIKTSADQSLTNELKGIQGHMYIDWDSQETTQLCPPSRKSDKLCGQNLQ